MPLAELLEKRRDDIVNEATGALSHTRLRHYGQSDPEQNWSRLAALCDLVHECVRTRDLIPMRTFAQEIARERHQSGFDLQEVHTAFNVVEEVIWKRIIGELPAAEYPEALALASTVLGAGKEALAEEYVALASQAHGTPSIDVKALFRGV